MRGWRRAAALGALAAGSTLLALAAAELLVRLFAGGWVFYAEPRLESGPHAYTPGQRTRFAHPEWDVEIAIDARGFRDEPACPRRGAGDVVMLGDSFVEAYGVALERSVSKRLEALLGDRHVYNAGHYGTQTAQYVGTWRAHFAGVPHARVLLGFYMGNDFVDEGAPDRLDPPDRAALAYRVRALAYEHCALFNFLRYHVRRSPALFWLMGRIGLMTFIPVLPEPGVHDRGWSPRSVAHTAKLLGAFGSDLAARGKRLDVFLIPTREQAEEAQWRALIDRRRIDPEKDARFGLNETFAAALKREGVGVVDLGPELARTSAGEPHYFVADRHWSPAGHERAAQILKAALF